MFVNFCIISVIMRGTKVKNGSCGLAECFSAPSALTQHPAGVLLSAAENYLRLHSTSTFGRDLFQLRFENETKTLNIQVIHGSWIVILQCWHTMHCVLVMLASSGINILSLVKLL